MSWSSAGPAEVEEEEQYSPELEEKLRLTTGEEMAPRDLKGSTPLSFRFRKLTTATSSVFGVPSRSFLKSILIFFAKFLVKLWKWASSFVIIIFFAAWFYGGILPYIVTVIALLSLGYQLSDTFLYQPDMPPESRLFVQTPASLNLPFESVEIHTSDRIKLSAYLIKQIKPSPGRPLPIMIYFHGNAGNIGHRLDNVKKLYSKLQIHFLMVEYRGYGNSEGVPSEKGFYLDAQAAFDFVDSRPDLDSAQVILFGRSLGGAVAVDLASRNDYRERIKALIVENTFTSIPDIARVLIPHKIIKYIPNFCFKNRFETYSKISKLACPVLFISGTKDDLIPPQMSNELYLRASSPLKRLKKFPNGGHNDTWTALDYAKHLADFIQDVNDNRLGISPEEEEEVRLQGFQRFNDNINIV